MGVSVKDMTKGNPGKLILGFSIPLMAGNVFQQLYTTVDTMVVGQVLGVSGLAAFGADDWLSWMMLGIVQGAAQGFAIRMTHEFGAKDEKALRKTVGNAVILAIAFSLVMVLIGQLLAAPALHLLRTKEQVFPNAITYLRLYYFGAPVMMMYNLFASMLRALGDSKTPLNAMIVASITNIGLDVLFVMGFHWGIAGAAIATIIAQVVAAVFCLIVMRKISILHLKKSDFQMDISRAKNLLYLGMPMAFQNIMIAVGGMVIQAVVNGFSIAFIAGITAINKLYGLLEIAATSYGFSMVTYTGQNLGAGQKKRIRQGVRDGLVISVLTSLVMMVVMFVFGRAIVGIFISGTPSEVKEAIEVGYSYLKVMSIFLPVLYCLHVIRSAIQGVGNTLLPMLSGVSEFIMRTASILLLPALIGESGVYFAEVSAWFGAMFVLVPSYFIIIGRITKNEEK